MSLFIDIGEVSSVLVGGNWYAVKDGTFGLDAYEFFESTDSGKPYVLHSGGESGVCATGFAFKAEGSDFWTYGPLTSLQAVRCRPS